MGWSGEKKESGKERSVLARYKGKREARSNYENSLARPIRSASLYETDDQVR